MRCSTCWASSRTHSSSFARASGSRAPSTASPASAGSSPGSTGARGASARARASGTPRAPPPTRWRAGRHLTVHLPGVLFQPANDLVVVHRRLPSRSIHSRVDAGPASQPARSLDLRSTLRSVDHTTARATGRRRHARARAVRVSPRSAARARRLRPPTRRTRRRTRPGAERQGVLAGSSRHAAARGRVQTSQRNSAGETRCDPTVEICRDVDRLDLGGVGICPPPHYLCPDAARGERDDRPRAPAQPGGVVSPLGLEPRT